jgi:nitroreductase
MISKPAPTDTDIHPLLQNRWSGRAFDPHRPVEAGKMAALAEAARWAPSSMNAQPWRFTLVIREQDAAWSAVKGSLATSNQAWAEQAPMLLVIAAETLFPDGKPNRWATYDTGAAMMALSIEATFQGLMVHQMGGFNPEQLREALALPTHWELLAVAAIGYQLPKEKIPASLAERELAQRVRNPKGTFWLSPKP